MMSTIYKFFDAMTRSVAAYRMTQLGYHDEAKRLMCDDS
jgi:hypothetical protein|tara:strand:+ start:232 stop:348 length:117 start_codon:yes stop_codon:yes gene_type:complete